MQGQNRPDIIAKFHAIEAVPFVALLWLGVRVAGVEGAAWAWSFRVVTDTILLFWAARLGRKLINQLMPAFVLLAATLMGVSVLNESLRIRLPAAVVLAALGLIWGWFAAPEPARNMIGRITQAVGRIRTLCRVAA
jgi:O-antigen/teichoic acid export membrane protein